MIRLLDREGEGFEVRHRGIRHSYVGVKLAVREGNQLRLLSMLFTYRHVNIPSGGHNIQVTDQAQVGSVKLKLSFESHQWKRVKYGYGEGKAEATLE